MNGGRHRLFSVWEGGCHARKNHRGLRFRECNRWGWGVSAGPVGWPPTGSERVHSSHRRLGWCYDSRQQRRQGGGGNNRGHPARYKQNKPRQEFGEAVLKPVGGSPPPGGVECCCLIFHMPPQLFRRRPLKFFLHCTLSEKSICYAYLFVIHISLHHKLYFVNYFFSLLIWIKVSVD